MATRDHGLGLALREKDPRDYTYAAPEGLTLPAKVDLSTSGFMPVVSNQERTNACTGHGTRVLAEFVYRKMGWHHPFVMSAGFIYGNALRLEGTFGQDVGADPRDALKALHQFGVTSESNWPSTAGNLFNTPPEGIVANALRHTASVYLSLSPGVQAIKQCLAEGFVCTIGIDCYSGIDSMEAAQTGNIPNPQPGEQPIGGHDICVYGYDDNAGVLLLQNSWGTAWGNGGRCTIRYDYPGLRDAGWTVRTQS